ncbi:hypothetical protein HPP92_013291 [Vanilla planifolia]|uniref:N-acetyltransferase domain-containing protein n=1 Tax=Vanilla planifolia TaxID=51239 RepID=A0A835QN51_VANPL|nr:hypothetical protein HPP92_013291 [Vanilla planifolia]
MASGMSSIATTPTNLLPISTWRTKKRFNLSRSFASQDAPRTLIRASYEGSKECKIENQDEPLKYPRLWASCDSSGLRFNRLQPSEEEIDIRHRRFFERFVAREAVLDEEYWAAAWLRAEAHWENQPGDRYAQFHKRKFADQEFNAIKRRCKRNYEEDCTCIIAVKKEEKGVKRTVIGSIIGTLDFSIRRLLCGQTFPGEHAKAPLSCGVYRADLPRFAYIANLCVAKHARRQGVASSMLLVAMDAALSCGIDEVFVNVDKHNVAAQKLYEKIGFSDF